ncbi:MAG: HDIG domain-containing protein [Deltaproteobacteria bacterium]|nr:HDIG domain-containing protein [Deltaproteobacteria bacterium]
MANKKSNFLSGFDTVHVVQWGILLILTAVFTVILYPSLVIKEHTYKLGEVADRNIKAPNDFFIEDRQATDKKRQDAIRKIRTVYDFDKRVTARLVENIDKAFATLEKIYTPPLPLPADSPPPSEPALAAAGEEIQPSVPALPTPTPDETALHLKPQFEKFLGVSIRDGAYQILLREKFSTTISDPVIGILKEIQNNGVVVDKEQLLAETDRGITLRNLASNLEHVTTRLRAYYGLEQAKTMVRIIGDPILKDYSYQQRNLIVDLVERLILPNITLNRIETQQRRQQSVAQVKTVLYQIKAGEMILREGERVTPIQLKKLQSIQSPINKDQVFASSFGAALLLMCILVTVYHVQMNRNVNFDPHKLRNLLLLASVLAASFFMSKLSMSLGAILTQQGMYPMSVDSIYYGLPIAAGAMIICLFLNLEIAIAFGLVSAISMALFFQNRFGLFVYFFLNSTLAAYWVQPCRGRKVFIQAGLKLGLLNVLTVTALCLYTNQFDPIHLMWNWAFAFLGGIGVGIITLGLAPLIELGFGYTTDITLLELANLDQPLLRNLMIQAPGTYHHSIIVGSLVEAAAAQINANPLLGKVCGYYHDIGKVNKPLYFIENQQSGKNKHDKLAPSMSSLILISHIKHGVEIATSKKLGREIIDTIRQHHGTSLIKYFFDKAQQQRGEHAVKIEDFRYPGPKPQTREAGLVMLADVVEAACRTLDNPTPARIQGLVQNLINKIFSDGQLDNCELTLKDLHNIAKSFNKILNGIYHHRIEYPDSSAPRNGKGKNGNSDRQPAKQAKNLPGKDKGNSSDHLKRLGLS